MMVRMLEKYNGKKRKWLHDTIEIIVIFTIVLAVFRFVIGVSSVKGTSMFPTLHNNEIVLFTRIVRNYDRNDIVSVQMPSGDYYVKRIVAVEGDTVNIANGKLYINGKESDEPFAYGSTGKVGEKVVYPLVVEPGKVFVLGDNREHSKDSRSFGTVIKSQIKGKLWLYAGKL